MSEMVRETREDLERCKENTSLRLKATAFIRERSLGAKLLLTMILSRLYKALQLEIDDFYEGLGLAPVSKQAFSKARQQLNPEIVRGFFDRSAQIGAEDPTLSHYRGMRLIAIDGSYIELENTKELRQAFDCSGPGDGQATALSSIAYGPLDHVIYDCRIAPCGTDERALAREHLTRLCEMGLKGSLLLFDRGYPSADFIACLTQMGFPFVMRVRKKWNLQVDDIKTQGQIAFTHEGVSYTVRVLKVLLPSGEPETLLTSLPKGKLALRDAAALYFKRWAVETAFDLIKSKLQLENFSGKTRVSVLQDFFATMYLANLVAFTDGVADQMIAAADLGKGLPYKRQANRNRSIHKLRNVFVRLLLEPDPKIRDALLSRLFDAVAMRPLSTLPDRDVPRRPPRYKRFHIAKKSVL
jgi:hypothetical protein